MKISKQTRRDAREIFRSAEVNGRLEETRLRQRVDEIVSMKPRGYVGILSQLLRLVKLDQDRRSARVESFSPLSAEMQSQLKANLERRFGAGLNFSFVENASLLGGIRVRVGSDVFDGTVRGRLEQLKETFDAI